MFRYLFIAILIIIFLRILRSFFASDLSKESSTSDESHFDNIDENIQDADFEELD